MTVIAFLWILGYILVILALIYRYFVNNFDYFLDQAIHGPQPVAVFGTWWNQWKKNLPEVQLERYKKYGRIFGTFDGKTPNLVVGEPELLRKILLTDFDNFVNRVPIVDMKNQYANNMLFALNDYKWKDTRNALSPAFTSDKMKQMRYLITECAETLIKHMTEKSDKRYRKLDLRSTMTAFALDVIASCGFGTKVDTLGNPSDPFAKNGARLFNSEGLIRNPIVLLFALYPSLGKLIPSSAFKEIHFFSSVARMKLEERRKQQPNSEKQNDFMDIMMQNNSDNSIVLNPLKNEVVLTAQVLQLLLAGTDTTSSVLTNLLYNLALNEVIQDKLRTEILHATDEGKDISFEAVAEIPYLQQCISETLRLYPPVVMIDRVCNKTTKYGGIIIKKDTFVTVPIYAIHMDPEFYPKPDIFDPERFSRQANSIRDPMTYLPFGEGPRSCIGARFAQDEIKIVLCHLISKFRFSRTIETPEILDFVPGVIPFYQTKKILLNFEKFPKV